MQTTNSLIMRILLLHVIVYVAALGTLGNAFCEEAKTKLKTKLLTDFFLSEEKTNIWEITNEQVYGGESVGRFELYDGEVLILGKTKSGSGGLLSFRSKPKIWNTGEYEGLLIHLKGDGKSYLATIRTKQHVRNRQISWRAKFTTKKNLDNWQVIKLPFESFHPYVYKVDSKRFLTKGASVDPESIESIGIMIDDSKTTGFKVRVDKIEAYKTVIPQESR